MQAVFGKDYQADSGDALADLPDPDNRQVRSRYLVSAVAHTVLPNGVTVLVANAENANAEGKADSGHASPGLLNVFFLKRDGARWQVLGRHENIGAYGSFGQLGDVSWVTLAAGKPGMAIEDGYTGQGYSISQLALFDLSGNRLLELAGGIELHSDNQGACGPETSKCWDVSGQFSFVAPKTAGASYDDLLLVFSGESSVARENGKPQPDADDIARDTTTLKGQARYAYDGKRYRLIEGENIVPGV